MIGGVSLVGAGPGDPDLLTRKALRCLQAADLVLYDALVAPGILDLARHAQRFCVGKRAGRRSMHQETIHRLMIRAARRGKWVVRLKCGDPVVLGRGGEEALALKSAGVACEIVPGITSAVAAPELAGIPLTHRGLASAFLVVSGHAPATYRPVLESVVPGSLTLVILMGLATRADLSAFLRRRGWPGRTPAAILLAASTPDAVCWTGTLAELEQAPVGPIPDRAGRPDAAGTIVIGEVVGLRSVLAANATATLPATASTWATGTGSRGS